MGRGRVAGRGSFRSKNLKFQDMGELSIPRTHVTSVSVRLSQAEAMLRPIIKEFLALRGTDKGRLIDLSCPDDSFVWPTTDQYKALSRVEQNVWHSRARLRATYVLQALQNVAGQKTFGHYQVSWTYIGSGRVLLYWRFLRVKSKKIERVPFTAKDSQVDDLRK